MVNHLALISKLQQGDVKSLARAITIVENELDGYEQILESIKTNPATKVIGITGPPGAGKSTLINATIKELTNTGKKVGVIAIDPTSPFNFGSLLGDRLRMAEHFNNDKVFIRSLATRGSLGGLSAKTIEISDVMRSFDFDYLFIETVGVGQSEVEIAGLADITVVVLVPEAGDEVQTLKSGIMEIADVFVVNKSDREGANTFVKNLTALVHSKHASEKIENENTPSIPVIKTSADKQEGILHFIDALISKHQNINTRKSYLLAEKAYKLIQHKRMKDISKTDLKSKIEQLWGPDFNLYTFIRSV